MRLPLAGGFCGAVIFTLTLRTKTSCYVARCNYCKHRTCEQNRWSPINENYLTAALSLFVLVFAVSICLESKAAGDILPCLTLDLSRYSSNNTTVQQLREYCIVDLACILNVNRRDFATPGLLYLCNNTAWWFWHVF